MSQGLSFRILPGMFHYDPGQLLLWGRAKEIQCHEKVLINCGGGRVGGYSCAKTKRFIMIVRSILR